MGVCYGWEMVDWGIIVLVIDYCNFGESGGQVCQFDDFNEKVKDLFVVVIYFLLWGDMIEMSVGFLGICVFGGVVFYVVVKDKCIGVVVIVVGWFVEFLFMFELYGGVEVVFEFRVCGIVVQVVFNVIGNVEMIFVYYDMD